jgi:hypothetical protein
VPERFHIHGSPFIERFLMADVSTQRPDFSTQAPARAGFGNDAFTHVFRLPSHGIPYVDANGVPLLPDNGSITVRMMTGEEEAILNSDAYNDQAKIAKIVQACSQIVTTDGKMLSADQLLTTDRLMLILFIRAHSLGSIYRLPAVCPNRGCGCEFEHAFNLLTDLDIDEMPRVHHRVRKTTDPVSGATVEVEYEEVLTYDPRAGIVIESLPTTNYGVRLRLLTGRDEDWIAREAAKGDKGVIKSRIQGDVSFFLRMVRMISAIRPPGQDWQEFIMESAKDIQDVVSFVRRLPIRDTNRISRRYLEHDVGVNTVVTTQCKSCGGDVHIPFRILNEFFRPTVGDDGIAE